MCIDYIPNDAISSVYEGMSSTEIVTLLKPQQNLLNYRKIGKNSYVDLSTGELKEYRKKTSDFDKNTWLKKSIAKLIRIIDYNFAYDNSELFITLTFRTMVTYQEARKTFVRFWERFNYHYKNCGYIMVIEPNANGKWHLHILVKCFTGYIAVSQSEITSLWGHGYARVKRISFRDFGKYFAKKEKLLRADLYPPHVKLFTASHDMVRPAVLKMSYEDALKLVEGMSLVRISEKSIYSDDKCINIILYEKYRRK